MQKKIRQCWSCDTTVAKGPWHGHKHQEGKFLCGECFQFHKENSQTREEAPKSKDAERASVEAGKKDVVRYGGDGKRVKCANMMFGNDEGIITYEAAFNAVKAVGHEELPLVRVVNPPYPQEQGRIFLF